MLSRANIRFLDLSIFEMPLGDKLIASLMPLVRRLISLNFFHKILTEENLFIIGNKCSMIEEISFAYDCNMGENGLEILFKQCPNLKYLNLSGSGKITGECFEYIPNGLLYLNLPYCGNITSKAMKFLAERTKNLGSLIMDRYYPTENPYIWLQKLTKLKFLEITNMFADFSYLNLSIFPELEMLNLSYNNFVSIQTLETLPSLPKLTALNIGYSYEGDQDSVFQILRECKNIKYCDLSFLKNINEEIIEFIQFCQIKYLAINECNNLSDDVVKALISECNSLTHLEIVGINNYNLKLINSDLSKICPTRSEILNLVIHPQNEKALRSRKWYKIYKWDGYKPKESPFADLINVRIQYNKR